MKYDADKAAEAREAGKKRKAEYRARKKALDENKESYMDLSDVTLASDDHHHLEALYLCEIPVSSKIQYNSFLANLLKSKFSLLSGL